MNEEKKAADYSLGALACTHMFGVVPGMIVATETYHGPDGRMIDVHWRAPYRAIGPATGAVKRRRKDMNINGATLLICSVLVLPTAAVCMGFFELNMFFKLMLYSAVVFLLEKALILVMMVGEDL